MNFFLKNIISFIFFLYFLLGITIYKDYGITTDELQLRKYGFISGNYIAQKILPSDKYDKIFNHVYSNEYRKVQPEKLENFREKHYGATFEMIAVFLEIILGITSDNTYQFRHMLNFFVFFISLIFFYKLLKNNTKNNYLSLLGVLLIVIHPHIFSHSFYNSKDIILLSFMIITSFFGYKFIKKTKLKYAVLFSMMVGLATGVRVIGIITMPFFIFYYFSKDFKINIRKKIIYSTIILLASIFFIILFWPFLWSNPVKNFLYTLTYMSNLPAEFGHTFLFAGELIKSTDLPWYSIFVIFIITTPVFINLLLTTSIFYFFYKFFYQINLRKFDEYFIENLSLLGIVFTPIIAIIFLKSNLFDSWRHLFFIYPFLVIFIINFIFQLIKTKYVKKYYKFLFIFFISNLLYYGYWSYQNHPLQITYYNNLYNKNTLQYFVKDYWGSSNKLLLDKVLKENPHGNIYFDFKDSNLYASIQILKRSERKRFIYIGSAGSGTYPIGSNYLKNNYKIKDYYMFINSDYKSLFKEQKKLFAEHKKNSKWSYEIIADTIVINAVYLKKYSQ